MIKKRKTTNLTESHPHIAKQWHTELNGILKPNNFFIKQFNTHLNKSIINEVTDYNQKNKINEQEGGILIKMLEDKLETMDSQVPSIILTGILEFIDLILLVLSAIPGAGIPFDIANIIFSILRGDFWGIIPSLIGFIPVLGDVVGTVMKVIAKVARIGGKIAKWTTKVNKITKVLTKVAKTTEKLNKHKKKFKKARKIVESLQSDD